MFDYQLWIERTVSFTHNLARLAPYFDDLKSEVSVQPPLTESELIEIASKSDKYIPLELTQFWLTGSRHCDCTYICGGAKSEIIPRIEPIIGSYQELWGGASFINAADLSQHLLNCRDWAEETWVAEYPQDKNFWLNSVPFVEMNNGDYLSLNITEEKDNPSVVYLSHDDESFIIAESFTDFLTHWERLCYIGPESWMLENFRNENGYINSVSNKAELLRELLGSN
jgi:hypothetical protein